MTVLRKENTLVFQSLLLSAYVCVLSDQLFHVVRTHGRRLLQLLILRLMVQGEREISLSSWFEKPPGRTLIDLTQVPCVLLDHSVFGILISSHIHYKCDYSCRGIKLLNLITTICCLHHSLHPSPPNFQDQKYIRLYFLIVSVYSRYICKMLAYEYQVWQRYFLFDLFKSQTHFSLVFLPLGLFMCAGYPLAPNLIVRSTLLERSCRDEGGSAGGLWVPLIIWPQKQSHI